MFKQRHFVRPGARDVRRSVSREQMRLLFGYFNPGIGRNLYRSSDYAPTTRPLSPARPAPNSFLLLDASSSLFVN